MDNSRIALISKEAIEFAPRLLAIQESPPRKLPKVILYLVLVLFCILLAWTIFGKLDIVATAEGKLIPKSYVKIVQPVDGGIVQEILVHEGQSVQQGDVLMRMDANSTLSDTQSVEGEMRLRALQLRRIDAELGRGKFVQLPEDPQDLFFKTKQHYEANLQAYEDAFLQEVQNLQKVQYDLSSAKEVLEKLAQTLPLYQRNATSFEKLAKEGFVSQIEAQDKERERIEKEQDFRAQKSTVQGLISAVKASEKRLAQITSNHNSQLENERSDAQSQYNKLIQEWGKNVHKATLLELKAPQSGIIKDLATHTQGSVVSPGSVLMSLVPYDDPLQAEIMIKNEDVGFVHPGQEVKIKLTAYPFQKYGMIEGEVIHVGADSIQSQQPQMDTSSNSNSAPQQQTMIMNYKALIKLNAQQIHLDDKILNLTSGMQTVCEIHLGKRTVMEYLLSPVQKAWHESGRER